MSKGLAIVTGGSRGIGLAIAQRLAQLDYSVAILARDGVGAEQACATLVQPSQSSHAAYACDVASPPALRSAFQALTAAAAPLKLLVNAAGVNHDALLARLNADKMENMLRTNLQGTILASSLAIRAMLRHRQGGNIVNLSSASTHRANPGQAIYSATKAGVEGFTRTAAKEVAGRGIRVNCVAPGFIETDMTRHLELASVAETVPLQRLGTSAEVAQVVEFLDRCAYITGQTVVVDGGLSL